MIVFEKDEHLVMEVRKHTFIFIVHTALHLFFAIVPLVGVVVLQLMSIDISARLWWLLVAGYFLWLLVIWVIYFIQWTDYYLDVWYVTNQKIYDVLQKGFFHRSVSILRFENIQDISVEIKGVIPTLLDFGKIHVQTAGETSVDFTLRDAKRPNEVKNVISSLLQKSRN